MPVLGGSLPQAGPVLGHRPLVRLRRRAADERRRGAVHSHHERAGI